MATRLETTFSLKYEVKCEIRATADRIWGLLTDAKRFPEWNTTVTSIEGTIAMGEKLAIKVPLAPDRTFRPKVTRFVPKQTMEWSDGMAPMFRGRRTFELTEKEGGVTELAMREEFSGIMLPMIKGSLPDFREAFDTYAADLKRAAE